MCFVETHRGYRHHGSPSVMLTLSSDAPYCHAARTLSLLRWALLPLLFGARVLLWVMGAHRHVDGVRCLLHGTERWISRLRTYECVRPNPSNTLPLPSQCAALYWDNSLVGKSRCDVGENVGANVGPRGNSLVSTPKLFKYRPHIAPTAALKWSKWSLLLCSYRSGAMISYHSVECPVCARPCSCSCCRAGRAGRAGLRCQSLFSHAHARLPPVCVAVAPNACQ